MCLASIHIAIQVDDLIQLSPFGNPYFKIAGVPGATVAALYQNLLNGWDGVGLAHYACTNQNPDPTAIYDVIFHSYDKDRAFLPALQAAAPGANWTVEPYRQSELDSSTVWSHYACTTTTWDCSGIPGASRDASTCAQVVEHTAATTNATAATTNGVGGSSTTPSNGYNGDESHQPHGHSIQTHGSGLEVSALTPSSSFACLTPSVAACSVLHLRLLLPCHP